METRHEFCWSELILEPGSLQPKFFSKFFGWEWSDKQAELSNSYRLYRHRGELICATYPSKGEHRSGWAHFVSTPSLELTLSVVQAEGGKVKQRPLVVRQSGRMAIIEDPLGNLLNLWEAANHRGFGKFKDGQRGTPAWFELRCSDLTEAGIFYRAVFGWRTEQVEGQGLALYAGKRRIAGLCQGEAHELNRGWVCYYHTNRIEEDVAMARELGAIRLGGTVSCDMGKKQLLSLPDAGIIGLLQV